MERRVPVLSIFAFLVSACFISEAFAEVGFQIDYFQLGWIPWKFQNFSFESLKFHFWGKNHKNDIKGEFPDFYEPLYKFRYFSENCDSDYDYFRKFRKIKKSYS